MARDIFNDIYGEQDRSESTDDQIYRNNLEEFNAKYSKPEFDYDTQLNWFQTQKKFDDKAILMFYVNRFYILSVKFFSEEEYCEIAALYLDYRHCKNGGEMLLLENSLTEKLNMIEQRMQNGSRTSSATS